MKLKKLASVMLALVMALALAMPALAATEGGEGGSSGTTQTGSSENTTTTVTIAENETHTYNVYQIFKGTYSKDANNNEVLSDVKWGKNGTGTEGDPVDEAILEKLTALVNSKDSEVEKAKAIAAYVDKKTNGPYATTSNNKTSVEPGYYLFEDANTLTGGDSQTIYIIQVLGGEESLTITAKRNTTSSDKQVLDRNDSYGDETEKWGNSADHDIGDDVSFRLTATLGDRIDDYSSYKLVFHDKLSAGLTLKPDTIKVKIGNKEIDKSKYNTNTSDFAEGHECSLEITIDDVLALGATNNSEIVVEYEATLNENAKIGSAGNPNTMYLEYSNDPMNGGMGSTTPKTVVVFTYKTIVNKVDEKGAELKGAEFTLEKIDPTNGDVIQRYNYKENDPSTPTDVFTFEGLDDGIYRLRESKTPDGYNSIEDKYLKVEATHDDDEGKLTELKATWGTINDKGEFVANTVVENDGEKIDLITGEIDAGSLSTQIENKSGTLLPETGGIGTTIFYVVGGVLVLAAVVFLITKRRMS